MTTKRSRPSSASSQSSPSPSGQNAQAVGNKPKLRQAVMDKLNDYEPYQINWLAKHFGTNTATMTAWLNELESTGLVSIHNNRVIRVSEAQKWLRKKWTS